MRLWLLRQAQPDLSKLELEVSTSCLSKISLLRLLLGQTNRDKDFPESLRYSVVPNIQGGFQALAYNGDSQLNSFITNGMFKIKVSNKNGGLPTGTTAGSNDFFLNASTVNAIFGRADTVRPDALMGYWLIRF